MSIRVIVFDNETGDVFYDWISRNNFDIQSESFVKKLIDEVKHYNWLLQFHPSARLTFIPLSSEHSRPDNFQ